MRIVFIGAGEIGVPTLQALLKSRARSPRRCDPTRQTSRALSIDRATAD